MLLTDSRGNHDITVCQFCWCYGHSAYQCNVFRSSMSVFCVFLSRVGGSTSLTHPGTKKKLPSHVVTFYGGFLVDFWPKGQRMVVWKYESVQLWLRFSGSDIFLWHFWSTKSLFAVKEHGMVILLNIAHTQGIIIPICYQELNMMISLLQCFTVRHRQ